MTAARDLVRLATAAVRVGFADLAAVVTLRTWIFGWFARLVLQVLFFSLFGLLLGQVALVDYRVIGNSAALACIEAMAVVATVVRDRQQGALASRIVAPSSFTLNYVVRGLALVIVGTGSSTCAFAIAASVFRIPVAMPQALLTPLVLGTLGLSSYCLGLALGALVMARPSLIWLSVNGGYLSVMTICGVNVPVSFWPRPVRLIADALPVTHGLEALRLLLAASSYRPAMADLAAEAGVAACWLAVAVLLLGITVRRTRRTGTFDLAMT